MNLSTLYSKNSARIILPMSLGCLFILTKQPYRGTLFVQEINNVLLREPQAVESSDAVVYIGRAKRKSDPKTTEKGVEVSENLTADKVKEAEMGTEVREDLNGDQVRGGRASSAPFTPNDTRWKPAVDHLPIFHLGV